MTRAMLAITGAEMKVWCEVDGFTCTGMISQDIFLKTIFINKADNFQKDDLATVFAFRGKSPAPSEVASFKVST